MVTTTKVHVVGTESLTNEGDFGEPGARATVGAARHTHDDAVLAETGFFDGRLELADEHGEVALRFGHGETASGESDTSRRAEAEGREIGVVKLVLGQHLLHLRQVCLVDT